MAGVRACLDFAAELKALERENRELRQANEILRKASAYFAQAELYKDRRFKVLNRLHRTINREAHGVQAAYLQIESHSRVAPSTYHAHVARRAVSGQAITARATSVEHVRPEARDTPGVFQTERRSSL